LIEKINGKYIKSVVFVFNSTANWLALSPKKMKKKIIKIPSLGIEPADFYSKFNFRFMMASADVNQNMDQIYHEKQRKQLCLLHTLNNLFQRREFEQQELDMICERLVLSLRRYAIANLSEIFPQKIHFIDMT
jgi:hypothetical protein